MLKNKKVLIGVVLVLLVGAYLGKGMLMPPAKAAKPKIDGEVYMLPKAFTLNLKDGRYATMSVALVLAPGQSDGASAEGGGGDSTTGIGTLPEEAVIRSIITNVVTNDTSTQLTSDDGRAKVRSDVLAQIKKQTDVKVSAVLITDVAVQ
jgi:flagellar FliL protein